MRTLRKFTGVMPKNSKRRNIDSFFNSRYRNLLDMGDIHDRFNYPMVNEKSTTENMVLEVAMPGVKKEDIQVFVENGYVQVLVEDQQELKSSADEYRTKEFNYHSLNQKFSIPENALDEHIDAHYENGVLLINVPVESENEEALLRRKINIQ